MPQPQKTGAKLLEKLEVTLPVTNGVAWDRASARACGQNPGILYIFVTLDRMKSCSSPALQAGGRGFEPRSLHSRKSLPPPCLHRTAAALFLPMVARGTDHTRSALIVHVQTGQGFSGFWYRGNSQHAASPRVNRAIRQILMEAAGGVSPRATHLSSHPFPAPIHLIDIASSAILGRSRQIDTLRVDTSEVGGGESRPCSR